MAEIKRNPVFWDPATGYSDDVVVSNTTSADVAVKRGMLLLSDGAGKYTLATTPIALATGTNKDRRIAIALEDATVAKASGTATIKAVKAGVVFIEELYKEAGYSSVSAPDYVLDELGGLSNIAFVHVKEA